MRSAALLFAVAACGPKVAPKSTVFDEELPSERQSAQVAPPQPVERAEAPIGKGLRSGTIERAQLIAVLDSGPGTFLRQLEVTPRMEGDRFIGWQLVQLLDKTGPLHDVDVVPGDVLLAVNGKALSRPDQLQTVWDSLRTANELRAQLWRGSAKLELAFAIEPKVDGAIAPAPATEAAPAAPATAVAPAQVTPVKPAPTPAKPAAKPASPGSSK